MGYIFEPEILHSVAKEVLAKKLPIDQTVKEIVAQLAARYPGHINTQETWIFNNAGGAMGSMYIIHASITEYVIIFGTPIGTEGHTGRFMADDYFMILDGEQWAFSEGQYEKEVWVPGALHHLPRGEARAYRVPERVWALEYARGFIPAMVPFGVADTIFSTLDFITLGRTFYHYGKAVVGELLQGKI